MSKARRNFLDFMTSDMSINLAKAELDQNSAADFRAEIRAFSH